MFNRNQENVKFEPNNPMKKLLLLGILFSLVACSDENDYELQQSELDIRLEELLNQASGGQGKSFFILPPSQNLTAIPQDPQNLLNHNKVALGRLLVHETATAGAPKIPTTEGSFSCASCHPVASSFYAGRRQGVGECGVGFGIAGEGRSIDRGMPLDSVDIQPIRPPTLLNVAYQDVALWNGMLGGTGTNANTVAQWSAAGIEENHRGFQGLETQGIVGQETHRLKIDEDFINQHGYRRMFDAAFPEVPTSERYTSLYGALAIAAFNRTLLSNQAPWQDYLKGDFNALSNAQKRGAIVFAEKGQCITCHTGPALKDRSFHAWGFGHFDDTDDAVVLDDAGFEGVRRGRGGFTGRSEDDFKFKTPTLYNLRDARFYGHGGTFTSVEEVIRYKNSNSLQDPAARNIAVQKGSIDLNNQEINDLVDFIENALYDPYLERYVPDQVLSGNCFPNADAQSRLDLGCN
jgi:cytochrome c peroxidase